MKYTVDYFIKKFSKIPDEKWCTHSFGSGEAHCALGHLGVTDHNESRVIGNPPPEVKAFMALFDVPIPRINDGQTAQFQQSTPRARILAALQAAKQVKRVNK